MHYRARADAYPAFLPPERVNWRTLPERQAQWGEFLRDPGYGRDRFLVVLEAPGAVGFVGGGPQRHGDPDFPAEVWSLYLLPGWRRKGHGRALMSEIARRLLGAGYPAVIVWTQAPNVPARAFYERLGGRYVRSRSVAGFPVVGYGWSDVHELL